MNEISIEELRRMPQDSYELIDIRDKALILYGTIPGAVSIPMDELESGDSPKLASIAQGKILVFYCQIGRKSRDLDELPCLSGRECLSLEGGYIGYVRSGLHSKAAREERQKKAEESIRRKFHKQLFAPFAKPAGPTGS